MKEVKLWFLFVVTLVFWSSGDQIHACTLTQRKNMLHSKVKMSYSLKHKTVTKTAFNAIALKNTEINTWPDLKLSTVISTTAVQIPRSLLSYKTFP